MPLLCEEKTPPLCEAIHSTETLVGKIHWRRKWQPIPVFLPGKFHGQRSLAGYSPWGHRESDTPERLHRHTQCAYPVWRTYARERSFHILPGALYAKLCVYIHVCKRVCVSMCMCMHAVGTNLLAYTRKDLFSIFLNSKFLFAHSM